jgi:hypothetical protein
MCVGMSIFIPSYSTIYPTEDEKSHLDLKLCAQEKDIYTYILSQVRLEYLKLGKFTYAYSADPGGHAV